MSATRYEALDLDEHDRENGTHHQNHSSKVVARAQPPLVTHRVSLSLFLLAVVILLIIWLPRSNPSAYFGAAVPEKAVILASYSGQDVSWLANVPQDWHVYRYGNDAHDRPYHDMFGEPLKVPINQGREAMTFLTFIIDHYFNLPRYMVFLHGHDVSWHQPERSVDILRALNTTALDIEGYIPTRCSYDPICEAGNVLEPFKGPEAFHDDVFMRTLKSFPAFWLKTFGHMPPKALANNAGAEFAASAAAIHARPLEFWQTLREPLKADFTKLDTELRDLSIKTWPLAKGKQRKTVFGTGEHSSVDSWVAGGYFEKLWHILLGKEYVYCIDETYCREVCFSNAIHCEKTNKTVLGVPIYGCEWTGPAFNEAVS